MPTDCRVFGIFVARCLLCPGDSDGHWAGTITPDRAEAATEAYSHRRTPEHLLRLARPRESARQAGVTLPD